MGLQPLGSHSSLPENRDPALSDEPDEEAANPLSAFWPYLPPLWSLPITQYDIAAHSAASILLSYRCVKNLSDAAALMRRRTASALGLGQECETLRKISSLLPQQVPATKAAIKNTPAVLRQCMNKGGPAVRCLVAEIRMQSAKELFGPTLYQSLCRFRGNPAAMFLLEQSDQDLSLALPGKEEDSLSLAAQLQEQIRQDRTLADNPIVGSLNQTLREAIGALLTKEHERVANWPEV
jgi:hypothetical protein